VTGAPETVIDEQRPAYPTGYLKKAGLNVGVRSQYVSHMQFVHRSYVRVCTNSLNGLACVKDMVCGGRVIGEIPYVYRQM
jgi:hypothetical protein